MTIATLPMAPMLIILLTATPQVDQLSTFSNAR